jgi:hypothetical protein
MQRIGHHPATAILRCLTKAIRIGKNDREMPILIVEALRSSDWASITFTGLRHEFDLRLEGPPDSLAATIHHLADDLGDADIPMGGHFLAEIGLVSVAPLEVVSAGHGTQRLRIDALTIRD